MNSPRLFRLSLSRPFVALVILVTPLVLSGCTSFSLLSPQASRAITVNRSTFVASQSCSGSFAAHLLDHTTTSSQKIVALYESNGSGLAINDLNNDGLLDIVLGNLHGLNTILWNEGDLNFRTQQLAHGNTRAVNIVDVNGDALLDIVFTRRFDKPAYWENTGLDGEDRFIEGVLPDVNNPVYAMDWGDVDRDGDLDTIMASYDTEIEKKEGGIFDYRGGGVGVFVYAREGDTYLAQRLTDEADSLALALVDLNADQRPDIMVGNDFVRPDYVWLRAETDALNFDQPEENWASVQPFTATAENTMSYDAGDVNNDGVDEIYATDMKPYADDDATKSAWDPLMGMMAHATEPDDLQIVENVLLFGTSDGQFENKGVERAVDATGWSWSSKFGDLDNDGFLDIYVVNGMIASDMLEHLPGYELVEENQALRNIGGGIFAPAPEWRLGSTASGRGMSMGDLDNDGDLDIVVNNLASPAQLFENQICGGSSVQVELRWPTSPNSHALGSRIILRTSDYTYYRSVRAASGYLSGDPSRVHFGVPEDATLSEIEIHWPDGLTTEIDEISHSSLIEVTR